MTDLDQAREWADQHRNISDHRLTARVKAAAEIIQSLPDQWVDVEEVRDLIEEMDDCLNAKSTTDFSKGIDNATTNWRDALKALITPKLPTLADMTQEEREACKWMQCEIDGQLAGILARVDEQRGHIWVDSGHSLGWKLENITPLPDLPKLEWPGGVVDCEIHCDGCRCGWEGENGPFPDPDNEPALPRPEDVPPNEPWLIEYNTYQWIGKRNRHSTGDYPWRVASVDGEGIDIAGDSQITLIHKLVPETHALPKGMRLADHEEYGRVVVSPYPDAGNDYRVFYSRDRIETETGASWGYANKNELTFLDGGN